MGSRRVLRSAVDRTAAEWLVEIGAINALAHAAVAAKLISFMAAVPGRVVASSGAENAATRDAEKDASKPRARLKPKTTRNSPKNP